MAWVAEEEEEGDQRPTRNEAAEYIHDMAGQLAEMAGSFGLAAAADALKQAQAVIEAEF